MLGGIADYAAVDESVELVKATSPKGAGLVNAVLRRALREPAAPLGDRTVRRGGDRPLGPRLAGGAVVGRARRRRGAGAAAHGQRAGRVRRCASTRSSPFDLGDVPARPGGRAARGARARRRRWNACGSSRLARGRDLPAVARLDARRPRARPAARRARARPLRRAGRQDHAPGRADGRRGRRSSPSSRTPAAPTALRRTAARQRATIVEVVEGDAAAFTSRRAVRPRARRPAVLGPRDAAVPARPALAHARPSAIAELVPSQRAILAAGQARPAAGRDARLLGVHDLARPRSPTSRGSETRRILPHRDGTEGFFVGRLTSLAH